MESDINQYIILRKSSVLWMKPKEGREDLGHGKFLLLQPLLQDAEEVNVVVPYSTLLAEENAMYCLTLTSSTVHSHGIYPRVK